MGVPLSSQTPIATRSSERRLIIFTVLALAYLLVFFHRLAPAVVALDLAHDLSAGGALLGLLAASYFYPYALMQLPAGLLADTWGPRRTITLFFGLAGLASILFGLATSLTQLMVARGLVGLGAGMVFVPAIKVLTRWFSAREFARLTGLLMAAGGLGAFSASAPLALLNQALGWRVSFITVGLLTLVLVGAIWLVVRDEPAPGQAAPGKPAPAPGPTVGSWRAVRIVLSSPGFWPLALWLMFSAGVFFSFGGLWGGPYLVEVQGLGSAEAAGVLSTLSLAIILGSPAASHISQNLLRSRRKIFVGASAALVLLLLLLLLLAGPWPLALLYVWFFLFSVVSESVVSVAYASVREIFPLEIAGVATGLVNLMPFLGGGVLQPLAGLILDMNCQQPGACGQSGYNKIMLLYLACAALAFFCALRTRESLPPSNAAL